MVGVDGIVIREAHDDDAGAVAGLLDQLGPNVIEVTSAVQRAGAHEFYRRPGYAERPKRFTKLL